MKLTFPPKIFVGFMILMLADYSFGVGKDSKQLTTIVKDRYLDHLSLQLDQGSTYQSYDLSVIEDSDKLIAKKKKRRKKKRRRKKGGAGAAAGAASEVSPILYLLPLGIGQFANGSAVLGSLFGIAQVGGIGFMFVNWTAANTKIEDTNFYIDERNAEFDQLPDDQKLAHQTETDENVQIFDAEAESLIASANIGLAVFLIAYAGSVVEAFVSGPSTEMEGGGGSGGGKKRRRKKRRRSSIEGLQKDSIIEEQAYEPDRPIMPSWDMNLTPTFSRSYTRVLRPELALRWKLAF